MIPVLLVFKDWALFFLRLMTGLIFVGRGWPELNKFKIDRETVLALFEFLGGLLLIAGIFTQAVALFFALEMLVVAVWKMAKKQKFSGGYEFELSLAAANLILVTMGGGLFAILF